MKKLVILALSLFLLISLNACAAPSDSDTGQDKEILAENVNEPDENNVEEDREKVAEEDAAIILNTILSGDQTGFKDLMGESYDELSDKMAFSFREENENDFTPTEYYTIPYDETTSFTPEEILENFRKTQIKVLQNIKEYEITDVTLKDDGETAAVKFQAHGIATKDLANAITLIRSNVFEEGLGGSWEAQMSQNEEVKKANELINYYLYFLAFDKSQVDVYLTDDTQEFTLNLKEDSGHYGITEDGFADLIQALNVMEYSSN